MIGAIRRRMMNVGKPKEDEYISKGLVFHLDGADATTDKWVDKIGGVEFTMHIVTLDDAGGVVFNGINSYGNYPNNLDFPSSTHTIEVVLNKTATSGAQIAFMINASGKVAFGFSSGNDYIITKSGKSNKRSTWYTGSGLATYSVTNSNAYKNCALMSQGKADTWYLRISGTFVGSRSAGDALFRGTIYQIRIYNRQLSDKEILHNQAIDMAKYGIN